MLLILNLGLGLDHQAEFLGHGNEGQVLGLGPGFGVVLGLIIQANDKAKDLHKHTFLENIEMTINARIFFCALITVKGVTCPVPILHIYVQ